MEPCHHGTTAGTSGLAPSQHQVVSSRLQRRLLNQRQHRWKLLFVSSPSSPTASSPSTPSSRGGASSPELRWLLLEHGLSGATADNVDASNSREWFGVGLGEARRCVVVVLQLGGLGTQVNNWNQGRGCCTPPPLPTSVLPPVIHGGQRCIFSQSDRHKCM